MSQIRHNVPRGTEVLGPGPEIRALAQRDALREAELTLEAFLVWLGGAGSVLTYDPGSSCGCPLALWLADLTSTDQEKLSSRLLVEADEIFGAGYVAIMETPEWMTEFLDEFDRRFNGQLEVTFDELRQQLPEIVEVCTA